MDPERMGFGEVLTGNAHEDDDYGSRRLLLIRHTSKQVAARDLTIGRTLDTSDDMARLMLVTHYAGTKMVRVYNPGTGYAEFDWLGTKAGYLSIQVGEAGYRRHGRRDDVEQRGSQVRGHLLSCWRRGGTARHLAADSGRGRRRSLRKCSPTPTPPDTTMC